MSFVCSAQDVKIELRVFFQAGIIVSDMEFTELTTLVDKFRGSLGTLSLYYDINIPLVYTQVVIIAVYAFFLAEIFSSQLIKNEPSGKFSKILRKILFIVHFHSSFSVTPRTINGTRIKDEELSAISNYIPVFR